MTPTPLNWSRNLTLSGKEYIEEAAEAEGERVKAEEIKEEGQEVTKG